MYPYISVYRSDETDFSHNGLRILSPTSCRITEILNGEYSLTLSHPLDEQGTWRFLIEYNIIKCQGQLFRIYRKKITMNTDGTFECSVDALHIFYDLNFYFILDTRPIFKNGPDALNWIMNNTLIRRNSGEAQQPSAEFTYSSDLYSDNIVENLEYQHTAYYQKMSVTKALIGADNSFVNVWGGEIKRDNFHFTINKQRGKSNAFNIRYGVDMLEIQETVDFSSYCESVYWNGSFHYTLDGKDEEIKLHGVASLSRLNMPGLPVSPMKNIDISITEKDIKDDWNLSDVIDALEKGAKDYMLTNCSPVVNYRISFANLKNTEKYKDFINIQSCELGDIGMIYNEKLNINTIQQIVKKVVNGITGEIENIDLGSLRKTFTSDGKVNGGYDSIRTELIKNEISYNNTWEVLGEEGYNLNTLNSSWNDLAGVVSDEYEEVT